MNCAGVMEKVRLNLQVAIEQNRAQVTWANLPEVNAQ